MLNVNPMHALNQTEFRIHLEEDNIILHGSSRESAGSVLRGYILLNSHEQIKVKSIVLKFVGKINVYWAEGAHNSQKAEKILLEKTWSFLPTTKKVHCLSPGQYKWDFELPLPGNLPDSMQHDMGQVSYRLKAYCDRPKFFMNHVDRRSVRITRMMLPSDLDMNQQVMIANEWANKVIYHISIPSKVYGADSDIPISFDLTPIADHLKVRSVSCSLKEYITCSTKSHHKTEGRIVNRLRDDHFSINPSTGRYTKTELLHVPSDSNHIIFDMSGDLIAVKHKIKFTVALQNKDGHISELRASVPVVIAPVAPEDDANILPTYENAWRSMPYDPLLAEQLHTLREIPRHVPSRSNSTDSSSTSSSSSIEDLLETMPWMGFDISRVPSYGTAMRTVDIPHQFNSTLPTYDSLVMA